MYYFHAKTEQPPKIMNINFNLNRFNVIECKISLNESDKKAFSTKIKVEKPLEWDAKRQAIIPSLVPENDTLDNIRNEFKKIRNRFDSEGRAYRAETLVTEYQKPKVAKTLLSLCQLYVSEKKKEGLIAKKTIAVRQRYLNKLTLWLKHDKLEGLLISDFNKAYANKFVHYLSTVHNNQASTINKHFDLISGVIQNSLEYGFLANNPLRGFKKLNIGNPDTTCISDEEFEAIKALKNLGISLSKTRDMLLFMSGSGIHIGDYLLLDKIGKISTDAKGNTWLEYVRGKTKTDVPVCLSNFPQAMDILKKYGSLDKFPKMAQQKYNYNLKDLGKLIGTDKNFTSKVVGRKKFTDTTLNKMGLSKDVVRAFLGHTTEKNLANYGNLKKEGILVQMENSKASQKKARKST